MQLPGGAVARRQGQQLVISRAVEDGGGPATLPVPPGEAVSLTMPGRTLLADGRQIVAQLGPIDRPAFEAHCAAPTAGVHFLDANKVTGPLTVSPRQAGDAFWPLGSPGRQSVGDFLTNAKLPATERDQVLCVRDQRGIVCVAPLREDDRAKVTADTARAIVLQVVAPDDT